jgi:hypothetical protein
MVSFSVMVPLKAMTNLGAFATEASLLEGGLNSNIAPNMDISASSISLRISSKWKNSHQAGAKASTD